MKTAQELKDRLDEILIEYGTLDVPLCTFQDWDINYIDEVDVITNDNDFQQIHSIELNLTHKH